MRNTMFSVTIGEETLVHLDRLIAEKFFASRDEAIQAALEAKLEQIEQARFEAACRDLDPEEERAMAEEGMAWELDQWPEY